MKFYEKPSLHYIILQNSELKWIRKQLPGFYTIAIAVEQVVAELWASLRSDKVSLISPRQELE